MSKKNIKPTLDGYDLEMPDKQMCLMALGNIIEPEEAEDLWQACCKDCGVSNNTENINELSKVFAAISRQGGAIGVLGRSLHTRAISYRILDKMKNSK